MNITDPGSLIILSAAVFLLTAVVYLLGRGSGRRSEKSELREMGHAREKKESLMESGKNDLLREMDRLRFLNEQYLHFIIRIPEAVKQINSVLSFDEAVSSVIRFTKDITDTDCIELYLLNTETNMLELEAAYGSNKKKRISVPYGEGIVGKTAEARMITYLKQLSPTPQGADERLSLCAPILFRKKLIGVLCLGKINIRDEDQKRLIAMIADLTGVSLQNCERLTSAQKQANTDALTGLYNRKFFAERSLDEMRSALSYNYSVSVFMFDIDHFKKYNDTNGHAEGDYLLRELAGLLKENTRGKDVIARYGGEEFIVLLPNTDKEGALIYGEKIRKLIEAAPFRNREKQPLGFVSISGGVATFPQDADTIETATKAADSALYKSKESGRNRVTKYEHVTLS